MTTFDSMPDIRRVDGGEQVIAVEPGTVDRVLHPQVPMAPPRRQRDTGLWLRENLFSSWTNGIITVVSAAFSLWLLWQIVDWAVLRAVWGDQPSSACRTEGTGACWAFITEKFRFILFGLYPPEAHWRVVVTLIVLLGMIVASCLPSVWPRRVEVQVVVGTIAAGTLLWGIGGDVPGREAFAGRLPGSLTLVLVGATILFPWLLAQAYGRGLTRLDRWAMLVAVLVTLGPELPAAERFALPDVSGLGTALQALVLWLINLAIGLYGLLYDPLHALAAPWSLLLLMAVLVGLPTLWAMQPNRDGETIGRPLAAAMMLAGAALLIAWGLRRLVTLEGSALLDALAHLVGLALVTLTVAAPFLLLIALRRRGDLPAIAYLWIVATAVAAVLMFGGVFGLSFQATNTFGGLILTVGLTLVGFAGAFPIAIAMALGRQSRLPIVRGLSIAYIEAIRGVPLITLLIMSSILLPLFLPSGVTIDKLLRAQIAIMLFAAAYLAEVVRGGLQSLGRGQYEAADSLGLTYWQKTRLVILPQALLVSIPPMMNSLLSLFKDTSLVTVIGLYDLLTSAKTALTDREWLGFYMEAYFFLALIYWGFCFTMSRYSQYLEVRLNSSRRR